MNLTKPRIQIININVMDTSSTRPLSISVLLREGEKFNNEEIKRIELLINKRILEIGLQKYLSNMFLENMVIFKEVRGLDI